MKFDFATLTETEFTGFVAEAQELKDKLDQSQSQLLALQATHEELLTKQELLLQEKQQAEAQQQLMQTVSQLRSQADQYLQDGKLSAAEYAEYFGKDLSEDITKYGKDAVELAIAMRAVARAKDRPVDKRISLQYLGQGDTPTNSHQTTLTAENLAC